MECRVWKAKIAHKTVEWGVRGRVVRGGKCSVGLCNVEFAVQRFLCRMWSRPEHCS